MRARFVVAIVIVSMLVPVLVWAAHHDDPRDPNDTRGPLDVKRIDVDRRRTPRFEVITWRGWTARQIWDHGFGLVRLDTFGSSRFDYYALVRSTGSRLRGDLFRDRARGSDRRLFALRTSKASRRSFRVRIPLERLRMPRSRAVYRWEVQTLFVGSRCRRTCFDFVPNQGSVRERNPFATTTTTPIPPTTMPTTTTSAITATTTPTTTTPTTTTVPVTSTTP
jgi:hypothetical protein